jgi:hypothetical protein
MDVQCNGPIQDYMNHITVVTKAKMFIFHFIETEKEINICETYITFESNPGLRHNYTSATFYGSSHSYTHNEVIVPLPASPLIPLPPLSSPLYH